MHRINVQTYGGDENRKDQRPKVCLTETNIFPDGRSNVSFFSFILLQVKAMRKEKRIWYNRYFMLTIGFCLQPLRKPADGKSLNQYRENNDHIGDQDEFVPVHACT